MVKICKGRKDEEKVATKGMSGETDDGGLKGKRNGEGKMTLS